MSVEDRSYCVPYDVFNIDANTRLHLTGIKPSNKNSICNKENLDAYCTDNFYGPIFSTNSFTSDLFYFGGLEKGTFTTINSVDGLDIVDSSVTAGFMYGLMEIEQHPLEVEGNSEGASDQNDQVMSQGMCFNSFKQIRRKANLGSEVRQASITEKGFTVLYD
jgi:hypothetical protein